MIDKQTYENFQRWSLIIGDHTDKLPEVLFKSPGGIL